MSRKENSKKKLEQIAINLLEKNKSYKGMFHEKENFIKNIEDISNMASKEEKDPKEDTMRDTLSIAKKKFEKILENNSQNNFSQKKELNTTRKKSNDNLKLCTTINNPLTDYYYYCCKKNNLRNSSSLVEEENEKNNENNSSVILYNNSKESKNININNIFNINNNIINENNNLYIIKFLSNVDLISEEKINVEENNKILKIYKYLINNFSISNNLDIIQLFSCEFIKIFFNGKINIILYFFNYSLDIIKFLFYQVFIFLFLLYLNEHNDINESIEMSLKTILLYSSQNFQIIFDIISNPSSFVNEEIKITKGLFGRNKIIYSILKTLVPKKDNKNNYIYNTTFKLIEEIESSTKLNRTIELRNNIYNKLDKHIINIKSNEYFKNKISQLENKNINNNILNIDTILNSINLDEENNNNNLANTKKILTLPLPNREPEEFNYKYTLFLELDETLVHYYEEGENYFVKVRQGTDEFLKTLHDFCEIIIVSTSNKEYTDIILENLNKEKNYVDKAIYKELCDNDNIEIDFRKINRDLKKCIFICHEGKSFFNADEKNIVELEEFNGEEDDKEIVYLQSEIMKLKNGVDDIRNNIKEINNFIESKRIEEKKD